jgi:hypothetical protein
MRQASQAFETPLRSMDRPRTGFFFTPCRLPNFLARRICCIVFFEDLERLPYRFAPSPPPPLRALSGLCNTQHVAQLRREEALPRRQRDRDGREAGQQLQPTTTYNTTIHTRPPRSHQPSISHFLILRLLDFDDSDQQIRTRGDGLQLELLPSGCSGKEPYLRTLVRS